MAAQDDAPRQDFTVRESSVLAVLARHGIVEKIGTFPDMEQQPQNVQDAIKEIARMVRENVRDELEQAAEPHYFYEGDGSQLDSEKIQQEIRAHMSQTGHGFRASHSNAHLTAAMSLALDWIGKATARELPTVHLLAEATRRLGTNRQGH